MKAHIRIIKRIITISVLCFIFQNNVILGENEKPELLSSDNAIPDAPRIRVTQETLIADLQKDQILVRALACRSLGHIGNLDAISPLGKLAVHDNKRLRSAALLAINEILRREYGKIADELLTKSISKQDKLDIAIALCVLGEPKHFQQVLQVLRNPNSELFIRALDGAYEFSKYSLYENDVLVNWIHELASLMDNKEIKDGYKDKIISVLTKIGTEDAKKVTANTLTPNTLARKDEINEQDLIATLSKYGVNWTKEGLIDGLQNKQQVAKLAAIDGLGLIGTIDAMAPLGQLIRNDNKLVGAAVLKAVQKIYQREIMPLASALFSQSDSFLDQFSMATVLGRLGDPSNFIIVLQVLRNPEHMLFARAVNSAKEYAKYALSDNGIFVDWVEELSFLIENENIKPEIREDIVGALGNIGSKRALSIIKARLAIEKDPEVVTVLEYILSNNNKK
jgi:HEAT repeat protein